MSWIADRVVERLRRSASTPDLTGTRYRVVEYVASGGMGDVYLAEDVLLARRVALKVVDAASVDPGAAGRLLDEARILASLEHPGIVPVHDAGTLPDGRAWYAMKYVEGSRLDEVAASTVPLRERLRLFTRICEPVAFAHARGIVHRDLKPENIMVGPFGEVLVMDWGVAAARGAAHDGAVVGTRGFMAPEQASPGDAAPHPRADVYSLGTLLAFLSSPPGRPSPGATPKPLAAIIAKATAEDPAVRYADAAGLGADVDRWLDGLAPEAYPENWIRKAKRLAARHLAWILLVLAYLVMRAMLLLWQRAAPGR